MKRSKDIDEIFDKKYKQQLLMLLVFGIFSIAYMVIVIVTNPFSILENILTLSTFGFAVLYAMCEISLRCNMKCLDIIYEEVKEECSSSSQNQ